MKISVNEKGGNGGQYIKIEFTEKVPASRFDGSVLTVKTGKVKDMGLFNFRLLLRSIIRLSQKHKINKIKINFDDLYKMAKEASAKYMAEDDGSSKADLAEMLGYELELANYNFNKYKTKPKDGFAEVKGVELIGEVSKKGVKLGQEIAMFVNKARDIANTPAQDMTPKQLANIAKSELKRQGLDKLGVKIKILNKKQIEAQKMGAFLAVSRASAHEPQLIIVEYNGGKSKKTDLALVGKAVTYDTGGLGLKPGDAMVDMHMDMTGGVTAMYGVFAMAKLGVKKNVVAVVPATENAIGKDAYRNSDILKSMSGKTIEVRHTDAEGRLILADALTYTQKHYKPKSLVDLATLTGAAIGAVGQHASLIMTNSCQSKLPGKARTAGAKTGNRVWQMPLWDVYKQYMKSKVADISNLSNSRWGGAITAGVFLAEFIDANQDWLHIDIAPRMESVSADNLAPGATGEPIYLLTKLVKNL